MLWLSGIGIASTVAGIILLMRLIQNGPGGHKALGLFATLLSLGLLMIIGGPLVCLAGFIRYALQKPTQKELSRQTEDARTWSLRPSGLLIIVGVIVFIFLLASLLTPILQIPRADLVQALGQWLGVPLLLGLLWWRRTRNIMFYPRPKANEKTAIEHPDRSKMDETAE